MRTHVFLKLKYLVNATPDPIIVPGTAAAVALRLSPARGLRGFSGSRRATDRTPDVGAGRWGKKCEQKLTVGELAWHWPLRKTF